MSTNRKFLVLGLVALLAGCSRLDWAVRFADTYMMVEADRFFDFSKSQKAEAKETVQSAIKSIRAEEFPKGAEFLEEIAEFLSRKDLEMAALDAWFGRGQALMRSARMKFDAGSVALVRTMTKEQDENFREEFEDRVKDLREETATPEKLFKRDKKRAMKWSDMWLDGLTREQEERLNVFLKENPTPIGLMIKHREKMFADFRAVHGEARAAWTRKFLENPEAMRSPEYDAAVKAREGALKIFLLDISRTLTEKQKKFLLKTLRSRAEDLRRLSKTE